MRLFVRHKATLRYRLVLLIAIPVIILSQRSFSQWIPTSGPQGGTVSSLLALNSCLYAACPNAGVMKSVDGGLNWVNCEVQDVCCLTAKGSVLFAGGVNGIYKTSDGGASWTTCIYQPLYNYNCLAANSTTVFSVSESGLLKSLDEGTTWVSSNAGLPEHAYTVFTDSVYVFAGLFNNGLYRSVNNGSTWVSVGLPGKTPLSMKRYGGYLFCGTGSRIYRSHDNGLTWTEMYYAGTSIGSIVGNTNGLYAASDGYGVLFSADLGVSWTPKNLGLQDPEVEALAFSDNILVAGTSSKAAFRSTDLGESWALANSGIRNVRIEEMSTYGNIIYAGTMYAGVFSSADGGASWLDLGIPEEGSIVRSLVRKDNFLFASAMGYLYRKTLPDSAWIWMNGFPPHSITVLAVKDGWVFAGTNSGGIQRSNDNGMTWQSCTGCFTDSCVTEIMVKGSMVFAACLNGSFYVSDDNGAQWNWLHNLSGNSNIHMAANPDFLFIAAGGKLFRSPDNGITLEQMTNGLPASLYPEDIVASPGYVAISDHIALQKMSLDNGNTWMDISAGMIDFVLDLALIGDTVYAGTWGNSVWKRYVYNILGDQEKPPATGRMGIFPNPADDVIRISLPREMEPPYVCRIINLQGQILVSVEMQEGSDHTVTTGDLQPGNYILQVSDGTQACRGIFTKR